MWCRGCWVRMSMLFFVAQIPAYTHDRVALGKKGIEYMRVEVRAAFLFHDDKTLLDGQRWLVGPGRTERVKHVGNGGDPTFNRNVFPLETHRIPLPVVPLVMRVSDPRGKYQ